jgi:hypothetical protein
MLAEGGQPQGHLLNGTLLQPLPLIAVDDRYRHNHVIHRRKKPVDNVMFSPVKTVAKGENP